MRVPRLPSDRLHVPLCCFHSVRDGLRAMINAPYRRTRRERASVRTSYDAPFECATRRFGRRGRSERRIRGECLRPALGIVPARSNLPRCSVEYPEIAAAAVSVSSSACSSRAIFSRSATTSPANAAPSSWTRRRAHSACLAVQRSRISERVSGDFEGVSGNFTSRTPAESVRRGTQTSSSRDLRTGSTSNHVATSNRTILPWQQYRAVGYG